MWSNVVTLFREYMGTGLIVIWYLVSLVYLFVKEKRKPFRILFLYVPVILLLLYFNPLFAQIVWQGVKFIIGSKADPKTGKFLSKNCKGEEMVRRIKEECPGFVFRNAYTDNPKSDAPLLSLAQNKFLIKNGEIIPLD